MKIFQIILTVLLLSTLLLDWGGYGISLIQRFLRFSNPIGIGEGLFVVFMSCILFLIVFIKNKKKEYLFWASITTFIFILITGFFALVGHSWSEEFDGAAPATLVLILLLCTFIFELTFKKKYKLSDKSKI